MSDLLANAAATTAAGVVPSAAEGAAPLNIFEKVQRQQDAVAKALPAGMDAARFVRMVLTEMRNTPALMECSSGSLLGAMMVSAQLGLEPGGPLGQAYLIPRWNNKLGMKEASFQLGFRGLVQLAARAGVTLAARTVRGPLDDLPGDHFEWEYGTSEYLRHRPEIDTSRPSIAWYAVAHFVDARPAMFTVIDRNVADRARAAGSAGDFGPWKDHYDAMAEKTAAIRLAKWLPLTTEAAYAVAADGAVVSGPEATLEDAARAAEKQQSEIPAETPAEPEAEPESEAPVDGPSPEG